MGFGIYPKKIPNTRPFTSHLPETTKASLLIYGVYQDKLEEKPEGRLHDISRYGDPERVLQQYSQVNSQRQVEPISDRDRISGIVHLFPSYVWLLRGVPLSGIHPNQVFPLT